MAVPSGVLYEWLKHPLLILLVTVGLSNYLIPRLLRRRENQQKEMELRIALLNEINETVTRFSLAVQFQIMGAATMSQQAYDEAYREWELKRVAVETKLRAYFPDLALGEDWEAFCTAFTIFYAITGIREQEQIRGALAKIAHYLDETAAAWGLPADSDPCRAEWSDAWADVRSRLLTRCDHLLQRVLTARIGFLR